MNPGLRNRLRTSDALRLLWQPPLWAAALALVLATAYRSGPEDYIFAFLFCLVFAFVVRLSVWVADEFVLPRLPRAAALRPQQRWLRRILLSAVAAILGALLAGLMLDATLLPGIMLDARNVVIILLYTLVFVALGLGLESAVSFYRLLLEKARTETELGIARRIHNSFLLSTFPALSRFDIHAVNASSRYLSCDFYDVIPAGEDTFLVAIGDVAGAGMSAVMLSSMLHVSLRSQAGAVSSVAQILENTNTLACRSMETFQFASVFLACVDQRSMRLVFSNAGHAHPILMRRTGERVMLESGGTVIGVLQNTHYEEKEILLCPGDRLILYTDGITDAINRHGESFGDQRLYDVVAALPAGLSSHEMTTQILARVREFLAGKEAEDDMTLVVLRAGP